MDRNKVNPADHISPIIFVLQRPVDRVVNDHFEQAEEKYWNEENLEAFRRENR